jgi:metal-responsive CopG/Arc/MetJ family transcriptional regulator
VVEITKDRKLYYRISEKMYQELKEVLEKTEDKKSEVIRNCLKEYIKKNK